MRVTAETKAATRRGILDASRRMFAERGFEATTTRDIAAAAKIATGTLFNYFPTKEAVVACLAGEAVGDALAEFGSDRPPAETLEEDLFALVAAGLRKLRPLRKHLPSLFETSLSPLASATCADSAALRIMHLEAMARLAALHGHGELSPLSMQIYWTLYAGVLGFWATDKSPKQEDTLALVDQSVNMFVAWLREHAGKPTTRKKQEP
jgi:AcrR family transcriptional regulator